MINMDTMEKPPMTFDEIVKVLMEKQKVIEGVHKILMEHKQDSEAKIEEFKKPLQEKLDAIERDLQTKMSEYKMECKKHFGIADGDQMNVVETLVAFKKAMSL
jgi:DNA-binding transcriptional MerR regulator